MDGRPVPFPTDDPEVIKKGPFRRYIDKDIMSDS